MKIRYTAQDLSNTDKCQWLLINVSNSLDSMTSNIYKIIGERIRKLRKVHGLSQEKLAERAGIDRSHMGFIEQGRRQPTIATLQKLTKVLGISLEELFRDL